MTVVQRCIYVEGIGRVHALGREGEPPEHFAAMDAPAGTVQEMRFACLAADVITGIAPGKIRWSVRFRETGQW